MAFFDCQIVQGGTSGTGIPLIVTCSEDFAGKIITATDGTTTITQICPSTNPYTVQFDLPNTGSWTISGVIEGVTYSETISVTEYQLSLDSGFNYKTWVSRGGLDPDDYASLSAVFADEKATRRLMLVHASADYLIDCVTDNIDDIDDFCVNDTAMKWLGLCDYICDGLTAITGVKTKFLASTYWERYLKDHVPTMTSNNAPYGTATALSNLSGAQAPYTTFDGVTTSTSASYGAPAGNVKTAWWGYQFTNPINVKKAKFIAWISSSSKTLNVTAKIVGSNDGTNWTDVSTEQPFTINGQDLTPHEVLASDNADYYIYKRLVISSDDYLGVTGNYAFHLTMLQFYGRSLNVSVPTMTSNTAPFGEVSADSYYDTNYPYKAFTSSGKAAIGSSADMGEHYISYNFMKKVKIKKVVASIGISTPNSSSAVSAKARIQSFIGLDWIDASDEFTVSSTNGTGGNHTVYYVDCNGNEASEIRILLYGASKNSRFELFPLQFYGVDYSEKEFEAGTTKKWLYDHGLELELISEAVTTGGAITFGSDYVNLDRTNGNANLSIATDNTIDLTAYSMLFTIADTIKNSSIERIGVAASRTTGVSAMTTSKLVTMTGSDVKDGVDISAVDESQYVIVLANNVGAFNLKEIWVE